MPLSSFPLIAWGSPDDINAYSSAGTPVLTTGVADPFGGTGAYTIEDNDGTAAEYKYKAPTLTLDGTQLLATVVRQGTATTSEVDLFDSTAGVNRAGLRLTWSGGVPAASIYTGSGTVYGVISLGGGWYLILWSANSVVAANSNRTRYFGAQATAASVGSTSYYVRNLVALDLIDRAMSGDEPREGSEFEQGPSGFEEAYIVGWDELLGGQVRWIPPAPTSAPILSGWYGPNEAAGINCGVKAMLRAGREKQLLRWVRDRADCSDGQDAYLSAPMKGIPDPERNGYRSFGMQLRGSDVFTGL